MPWRSAQKSLNAVRGCFGAAHGDPKKKAKCRKMAHEAKLWRKGGKRLKSGSRKSRKGGKR